MESYMCHCSAGFQGKHCNERKNNISTKLSSDKGFKRKHYKNIL